MPLFQSYKNLPELAGLSGEERREAWREAHWRAMNTRPGIMALASCIPLGLLGLIAGSYFDHEIVGVIVGGCISAAISDHVLFRITRSLLVKADQP